MAYEALLFNANAPPPHQCHHEIFPIYVPSLMMIGLTQSLGYNERHSSHGEYSGHSERLSRTMEGASCKKILYLGNPP